MIYPWQNEQWQQLQRAKQENRLPHAMLFVGMEGIGKLHFAECFMRAELCQQQSADSACKCHSCCLIKGKSHPNVLWIEPEKAGGTIKIDQVREVTDFIQQTSLQGEYRFVIINPANQLNVNAANALLKTLEEPSSGSILILITPHSSQLPATVLSRCQHIHFTRPETHLALEWLTQHLPATISNPELILRLTNGAPLAVLEWVKEDLFSLRSRLWDIFYLLSQKQADPLQSAKEIQEMEPLFILDMIIGFTMDILRLHSGIEDKDVMNHDVISQLTDLRQRTELLKISGYQNYLLALRHQLQNGINLNKQLMMEGIMIRWMECA
jgi:DNA polymerase-3 subunit delta'